MAKKLANKNFGKAQKRNIETALKKKVATVTLEPISSIISFDAISYRASGTFIGTIGHFKYPDKKEYEVKSKSFYISPIGRKNKQKIQELISEIYAYLNTRISNHAQASDYFFRIYLRLELNKETAEIVGTPSFDVDLYRHIGKIGGKHGDAGKYVMQVIIVDNDRFPLASIFKKGVSKIRDDVGSGFLEYKNYTSYDKAPINVQGLVNKDGCYLIIDNTAHEITAEKDEASRDFVYFIKDGNKQTKIQSEDDVISFVLKQTKVTPKIMGSQTGFALVDKEIMQIADELKREEGTTKTDVITNLLEELGIDKILLELRDKLKTVKARGTSDRAKLRDKYNTNLDEIEKKYNALRVEYEVDRGELIHCEDQYNKGETTDDNYRVYRLKMMKAIRLAETDLIDIQKKLVEKTELEIENLAKIKTKGVA
jgi:hypothetical protein